MNIRGKWLEAERPLRCPRDSRPWCVQPLSTTTDVYKLLIDKTVPSFSRSPVNDDWHPGPQGAQREQWRWAADQTCL